MGKLDIKIPSVFREPLLVPDKLLMGPGPANCPSRVLQAMSRPVLGHLHPECTKIMDDIKEGIRYIFQTTNALTLALSTSGHGGMEAVLSNILEPGELALIAVSGIWGLRAADMAKRYGAKVQLLESEVGCALSFEEIENALKQYRPVLFFVTQGDSSTGVLQKIEGLGDLCHKYDCLLAVDTVAALGGTPFYADRWGVDIVYTGSQKVLAAPPGLTPISFSPKAQEKIFARKTPVIVYYWDMTLLGDYWYCFGRPRIYHHTVSSNLLYALREALAIVTEEGIENMWERHEKAAKRLYAGLKELGLELLVKDENSRLPNVTTIKVPPGVDWRKVCEYAMKNHSLEISGGLGPTVGKVFRIGLMGPNATEEKVDFVLRVLPEALRFATTVKL